MNDENTLVDFHCHLDLYPNFEDLVFECERNRITTLAVTTTPRAWPRNLQLTKNLRYVRPALGLHPQLVEESFERELLLWESYLDEADFVGEVGLDAGPRFQAKLEYQKKIFRRILECCAAAGGKILSVHSVRSASLAMDLIDEFKGSNNRYIFHWFSGTSAELKRAIGIECYFSINSGMLASAKGRSLIKEIPLDRIFTETDGPFTYVDDGIPFTPTNVTLVLDKLSSLLEINKTELRNRINKNLGCLLQGEQEPS